MQELALKLSDYSRFDDDTAKTIVVDLNHELKRILENPNESRMSKGNMSAIREDMIACPQLYLSENTLQTLNLMDLLEP